MGYSSRTSVSPLAPLRPGDQIQPEDQRVALGKEPMGVPATARTLNEEALLCANQLWWDPPLHNVPATPGWIRSIGHVGHTGVPRELCPHKLALTANEKA